MDDSFCFVVSTQRFQVSDSDFPVKPVVPDLCSAADDRAEPTPGYIALEDPPLALEVSSDA